MCNLVTIVVYLVFIFDSAVKIMDSKVNLILKAEPLLKNNTE